MHGSTTCHYTHMLAHIWQQACPPPHPKGKCSEPDYMQGSERVSLGLAPEDPILDHSHFFFFISYSVLTSVGSTHDVICPGRLYDRTTGPC